MVFSLRCENVRTRGVLWSMRVSKNRGRRNCRFVKLFQKLCDGKLSVSHRLLFGHKNSVGFVCARTRVIGA
jgi:hypothetical protein